MANFSKLLAKLQPYKGPEEYVTDKYGPEDMAEEISSASTMLSPEDVAKIHNAESTYGQNTQNKLSSAKGNFQFIDSTRNDMINKLKKQGIDELPANPDRKDALLMKTAVKDMENKLLNSQTGPKDPSLENIYLMHKYGVQGALNALNNPKSEESRAKFKSVMANLNKKHPNGEKQEVSAKDLLDLLKD